LQSCSKEDENNASKNNEKSQLYANTGPFDLTGITVNNDMVVFSDTSIMRKLDSQIEDFNNIYNNSPNIICSSDTGNIAFENQLGFFSLRRKIDKEETTLENNDNLWDYNDPDDHFIYDDFERTILNEKLEYGIDNSVYKYINEFTLIEIIDDITTLNNIRNNLNNISPYLCSPNVTINSFVDIGTLDAAYTYTQNNLTFNFTNATSNATDYYWDFGDGTSSTLKNPTHTYSQSGYYDVVLIVSTHYNGVKVYDKKVCRIPPPGDCTANFNYNRNYNNNLELNFNLSCSSSYFKSITWSWGDGSPNETQNNLYNLNYNHIFPHSGKYIVKVTVVDYTTDCEATYESNVYAGNNDCLKHQKNKSDFIKYASNTRAIKCKFYIKNGIAHHRIKSKVINYKVKNNGSYKRQRADIISANYIGTTYLFNTCGSNAVSVNLPNTLHNRKKSVCKIINQWGREDNDAVRVLNSEITAYFYTEDNGGSISSSLTLEP
jgi:PKD repeat protein